MNETYQRLIDEEAFCWLHALDVSQVKQLGIAMAGALSDSVYSDTPPRYPSWVSLDADLEACWITAE